MESSEDKLFRHLTRTEFDVVWNKLMLGHGWECYEEWHPQILLNKWTIDEFTLKAVEVGLMEIEPDGTVCYCIPE